MTFFFGCEVVVDVDIPIKSPSVTLNGFLNPDSVPSVRLTASQHILSEGEFQLIENAAVDLYEDDILVERLTEQAPGRYKGQTYPRRSPVYTIKVAKDGYKTVTASTSLPSTRVMINDLTYVKNEQSDFGAPSYSFTIKFTEPQGANYYELLMLRKMAVVEFDPNTGQHNVVDSVYQQHYLESDDPVLSEAGGSFGGLAFSDVLINGKEVTLTFNTFMYAYGPEDVDNGVKIRVVLRQLSESLYEYKVTSALQNQLDGNPFAEPVPVYNNVEDGYGIFGGCSEEYIEMTIDIR